MDKEYNPNNIEANIQKYWDDNNSFVCKLDNPSEKFYCLSMFPYPSGKLHIGHVRNYTIGDVIARSNRMLGKNVFQPMGWDSFGLPAENAAIANDIHPSEWTRNNIIHMKSQLKRLGYAYDWSKEISTSDPDYYKWEQWFFLKLLKKKLVYKKLSEVNWDPVDKTVLANEQVIDGKGWRSGANIERREIAQWFLKITDYAESLLDDINQLSDWPSSVKMMQKNWIGKSQGALVKFPISSSSDSKYFIETYTTRLDTICGVTFLAVSPSHEIVKNTNNLSDNVVKFIEKCNSLKISEETLSTITKEGVDTGIRVINPITKNEIPVWVANYVLSDYGTGSVMSVPAHDTRDNEFAKKYNLPTKKVIKSDTDDAFTEKGILINSGEYDNMDYTTATNAILESLKKQNLGVQKINYRLRDWGISRQRYWGCPIPVFYHNDGSVYPVPDEDLPVKLPEDIDFNLDGNPLDNHPTWKYIKCPYTGKDAIRETDTFDTFFESSWYYLRFLSSDSKKEIFNHNKNHWLPVDQYIGGIEHAILHLLYARFFHKLFRDEGIIDSDEPFSSLLSQGMVLKDGHKMSKSKGNTIDPDDIVKKYGADTIRLFIMFSAPPEQNLEWSDQAIEGSYKFLKRLWILTHKIINMKEVVTNDSSDSNSINIKLHMTIKKVSNDIFKRNNFNTAIASIMEFFNDLSKYSQSNNINRELLLSGITTIVKMLSPITPHITQELWFQLGFKTNLMDVSWPEVDEEIINESRKEIVVQVNGKLRGKISIESNQSEDEIKSMVESNSNIRKYIDGCEIINVIYVKDRLINYVIQNEK
tara:strand:+ start:433 stop:2871 length:2439 start_codon:yes stop_codon:yes gene_type:complete